MVFRGIHMAGHFSHHNDLRFAIARRLKQHRIHAHIGRNARGLRLKNLRSPHFIALRGDP